MAQAFVELRDCDGHYSNFGFVDLAIEKIAIERCVNSSPKIENEEIILTKESGSTNLSLEDELLLEKEAKSLSMLKSELTVSVSAEKMRK